MALASGSKLGPYEIVSLLGVGGMGEVYRARERTVAKCVSHRPGLLAERYFHHGIDLNAQVGTYNVTSNRLGPDLT